MRYLFGFLCVSALGALAVVGCGAEDAVPCQGVVCDDSNECTNDMCDPATGACDYTPVEDNTACDFGGLPGLCKAGVCEDAMLCDDSNECTNDMYDPATGTCDYTPVEDGTSCSGGACLDGVCTALVTVSGTVSLDANGAGSPAEGAMVSWLGTSVSTIADASGRFSLELPIGNLFLQASKLGTWGEIQLVWTEGASELDLGVISDAEWVQWWKDLGVDVDMAKGSVGLTFHEFSGLGGESATLSQPYHSSWAENADNMLVMSDGLLPGGYQWLDFVNVDPTEELTVMPRGAEGVNACSLLVPETVYPVKAKFLTGVDVLCTPL